MLRGSGVDYDIRKIDHYAAFTTASSSRVPLGDHGDVTDRFMIRMLG